MLRKLKWQFPGEPLAARYNGCQGPVLAAARWLTNTDFNSLSRLAPTFPQTWITAFAMGAQSDLHCIVAALYFCVSNYIQWRSDIRRVFRKYYPRDPFAFRDASWGWRPNPGSCWRWRLTALWFQCEGQVRTDPLLAEVIKRLESVACLRDVRFACRGRLGIGGDVHLPLSDNGCCASQPTAHVFSYAPPFDTCLLCCDFESSSLARC
jgi:hypothetical protein